jgi:hypothetical protein
MANELERPEPGAVDESHDLDLEVLFSSSTHDAEMESLAIRALLEANDIPATVVGPSVLPSLEFQVRVPRERLEEARRVIDEARDAGPQAAEEAERATEGPA